MKERSTRCPPKLRILSALLTFAMLLTLLPVTAFAADEYRTIDDVQYVKRDGAIIWRVKSYSGRKSDLTLESKINGANVQIIDREAFKGNTTLTHVKLPQGLFMDIYDEAFAGCTNLASLDIPVTLSAIGQKAFQNCTSLKTFTLGGETEEDILNWGKVAVSAFEGCSSLESFTMNAISGRFQDYAFRNCIALKEVTIPKNINEFGTGVFDGCTSLTKIIYNGKRTEWETCPAKDKIPANVTVEFAEPLTTYGLSIRGIKANEANYADMLGDKKVEFVPTSNYLILNSANVSYNDATTAAIDSTLDKLTIAGDGDDTIENKSGPGIKTMGELALRSSHIVVKGTPAISAQSIVVRDDDYWYRTAADGTFVKSTGTVAIGNKAKLPLEQVNVQIKLSVIKQKDRAEEIIHNISKYANSQNKINMSDFNANDAYHVKMERLSRATPIPAAKGKSTDYWFYERARGQYLVELNRQPTAAAKKEFKSRCPKNRCISKTVAAKCVMTYRGYPDIVSKGLETSFIYFSDMVSKGEVPEPSEQSYIEMIAKVILFNSCDEIIKNLKFGGFKAQQDYYTVALFGKYYSDLFDPLEIWNRQSINAETAKTIEELAYFVWNHFQNPTVPGVNIGQWCKKEECWELLQARYENEYKQG